LNPFDVALSIGVTDRPLIADCLNFLVRSTAEYWFVILILALVSHHSSSRLISCLHTRIRECRSQKHRELPPGSQQSWFPNRRANKLAQNKTLVKSGLSLATFTLQPSKRSKDTRKPTAAERRLPIADTFEAHARD
jgi:hypothetical protein